MLHTIIRRALGVAAIAGGAAVAAAGARYATSKRINAAQRLGEALIETDRLADALKYSDLEPEAALAACAVYLINVAHDAASGISAPPTIDPIGNERKVTSFDGSITASVITTAHEPQARWQFEVDSPGIGRVSGSRRLISSRFTGPKVSMQTPDTVSIRLVNGYFANIESDLEFTGNIFAIPLAGQVTTVFGGASLSDSHGNVGRLKIEPNGMVSGTITCGTEVVGRFEGSISEGIQFKQRSA